MKNKRLISLAALLAMICSLLLGGCQTPGADLGGNSIINLDDVPAFSGTAYVTVNSGKPFFTEEEITTEDFEKYSPLDSLGRCGVAFGCIGIDIMPDDPREGSLSATPSGWEHNGVSNNKKYDTELVSGSYIYNRCHLIGFQLAGEGDNELNLITGTRYLNIEGMLPFENMVADYVKETENHVMYRVTPIYDGLNLVASGVLMEGYSVEDEGDGICFCIYAYNVQPGIAINYFTGENRLAEEGEYETEGDNEGTDTEETGKTVFYINTDSDKVHLESCRYANPDKMTKFEGSLDELKIRYPDCTGCGVCKPFE